MINVIKVQATGLTHTQQPEGAPDDGDLIAYYDDLSASWQCVRAFAPVRVKLVNGAHHYKSWLVWQPVGPLLIRRPNKDVTPLVNGERILAYQDNERAWHTWPRL